MTPRPGTGATQGYATTVGALFPSFARIALAPVVSGCSSPYPSEREAVGSAVPCRRDEFFTGRACAHRALRALGRDAGAIGAGPRREPLWPAGVMGSISHAGGWSGAVVARASEAWGLGFDLEPQDPPLAPEVERLVLTPAELGDAVTRSYAKLAFSAKESVYKCLFPATGWRLDFADVTVVIDLDSGRFTARVDTRFRFPGRTLTDLAGRFGITDGYLFTGLCIPAGSRGGSVGRPFSGRGAPRTR